MRNYYFPTILVVVSLLLFIFVWPQAVNKGVNYLNWKLEASSWKLPNVSEKPFVLGLDLLGGAHLLYEADLSKVESNDREDAVLFGSRL